MDTSKVTRLDVVDHRSDVDDPPLRAYYGVNVECFLQDDGRTLKVFVTDGEPYVADMTEWKRSMERLNDL